MLEVFDILGPIMIGPSSSHTAGAVRIGKYARSILGVEPATAKIYFCGSFAKTYRGHGTDKAIIAGLLGMDTDDERIRNSLELASSQGLTYEFLTTEIDGVHPNTVEIILTSDTGHSVLVRGSSIGGGNIIITKINETSVSINGKSTTIIIPHLDIPGMVAKVSYILGSQGINIHGFSLSRDRKGGTAVMTIEVDGNVNEEIRYQIENSSDIISCTILKSI